MARICSTLSYPARWKILREKFADYAKFLFRRHGLCIYPNPQYFGRRPTGKFSRFTIPRRNSIGIKLCISFHRNDDFSLLKYLALNPSVNLKGYLNRNISKYRIKIEHVNRRIKRFKMFQQRYRNKQRRHLLRISLIAGIYNYELRF